MVALSAAAQRNYPECRRIYDAWFDQQAKAPYGREDGWVRLAGAIDTESKGEILAHGGGWTGGDRTNQNQRAVLRTSARLYAEATGREVDGFGNNGGSVGILQQIPTPVAKLRTVGGMDGGTPAPWDGWGSIVECMVLDTCLPKFLRQLRVGTSKLYKGKQMADGIEGAEIVVDLLNVQQPAADEVALNYGASIVRRAKEIAAMFPRTTPTDDWIIDMADQAALDKFRTDITGGPKNVWDTVTGVLRASEFRPVRWLQVARDKGGVDWAYGLGVCFPIVSQDHYHFLSYTGFINTPHGEAPVWEDNAIEFMQKTAAETAPGAGQIAELTEQVAALAAKVSALTSSTPEEDA